MRAEDLAPPRPTPEDLEEACRETEHAVLAMHRKSGVPLVLWRNDRVVTIDPTDPAARATGPVPGRK